MQDHLDDPKSIISKFTKANTLNLYEPFEYDYFREKNEEDIIYYINMQLNPEIEQEKNLMDDFIGKKTQLSEINKIEETTFVKDNDIIIEKKQNVIIDKLEFNNKKIIPYKNSKNLNYSSINENIVHDESISENKEDKKEVHSRKDNIRKKVMKISIINIKNYIEKIGKIKLNINFDDVFGYCFSRNKAILKLKIYEILSINKENKTILEKAKPDLENEIIFKYLLTRTYEFILDNFYNNNRRFKIEGNIIEINDFKIFNDVIDEKKVAFIFKHIKVTEQGKEIIKVEKIKKYSDKEINEFKITAQTYFKNLKEGIFDERKPKINQKRDLFIVTKNISNLENFLEHNKKFI